MEHRLFDWLVRYGTPVLFFAQAFGIFGVPIPDELLLTVAGVLVRRGQLHGGTTIAAAVSGCIAGITISYVLGRTVGLSAFHRLSARHEEAFARAQRWFRRFGGWLLAFGYFIPGVRHVTAIAAGSAPLEYGTFASYAYPGAVLWCSVFLMVGYVAGDEWQRALSAARSHATLAALLVLLLVGGYLLSTIASRRA
jgi:membrane protein DedA with SNARE-associated domain